MMAGVDLVHVPGGGPVMTDLLGGQVQVLFGSTSLTIEQIRAGKLRALAVTSARRWEGLPDVPTVGDFVPGTTRPPRCSASVRRRQRRSGSSVDSTRRSMRLSSIPR